MLKIKDDVDLKELEKFGIGTVKDIVIGVKYITNANNCYKECERL